MGSHHPIRKSVAPEPTVIPDKLYFRIGDVARLCQVPAYVLRFWETEFPSLKPNKGGTGQRLYRKRDVEMALRIKSLLYDQGYTIPGARQVFKVEARPQETGAAAAFPDPQASALTAPPAAAQSGLAPPPVDRGEEIRLRAQRQPHLQALRDDLRALLTQLSGPVQRADAGMVAGAAASAVPAPADTASPAIPEDTAARMRPRLVLEPRQASQRAQPQNPKPHPVQRQQRDLFASDRTEAPDALEASE